MNYIMYRYTSEYTFIQSSNNFIVILQVRTNQSTKSSTVFFINNNIVWNIYQTTSQITGISSLQRRISQTFTSTVGRDKILQHRKSLFKVRQNRVFNNLTTLCTGFLRFSHQTTHTRQLTNLLLRTTGTRIKHHVYRVKALIVRRNSLHQNIRQLRVDMCPNINNLIVTFVVGNETHIIVIDHLLYFVIPFLNQCLFLFRDNNITQVEWQTALEGHLITEVLDSVKEIGSLRHTTHLNYITNNITKRFLRDNRIDIASFRRNNLVHNNTSDRSLTHYIHNITILVNILHDYFYRSMDIHLTLVIRNQCLFRSVESQTFTFSTGTQLGNIIQTKNHILCRHSDRSTIGRIQNIMWLKHQHLCFKNSFIT